MVVLKPLLEGERMKTCRCGHVGLASPVPERTSFHPRSASSRFGEFNALCRRCNAAQVKAYEKHRHRTRSERYAIRQAAMSEAEREEQRRKWRDARARRGRDPEVRARRARNEKRYRERRKKRVDPETLREIRRIDSNLRKERTGRKKLPSLEKVIVKSSMSKERLPIAPFRAWLEKVINSPREDAVGANAADFFKVSQRRLHSWRYEYKSIDYSVVDRAASRHGGTTVEEIYRLHGMNIKTTDDGDFAFVVYQQGPEAEEVRRVRMAEQTRRCKSPGCDEEPGEGKFCASHVELFDRVRKMMEEDSARVRAKIGKKNARATCCNKACGAPRLRTERYCEKCQEDGWDEADLV